MNLAQSSTLARIFRGWVPGMALNALRHLARGERGPFSERELGRIRAAARRAGYRDPAALLRDVEQLVGPEDGPRGS